MDRELTRLLSPAFSAICPPPFHAGVLAGVSHLSSPSLRFTPELAFGLRCIRTAPVLAVFARRRTSAARSRAARFDRHRVPAIHGNPAWAL